MGRHIDDSRSRRVRKVPSLHLHVAGSQQVARYHYSCKLFLILGFLAAESHKQQLPVED